MQIFFDTGYSARKRQELEANNLLSPEHAMSTEYLLRWLEKIEPLEGKEVSEERLIIMLFDQMLNFYEVLRNFESRLYQ